MLIQSGRQVVLMWAGAIALFMASAWASTALLPAEPVARPPASYYVGLVGLLAIGAALVMTWMWAGQEGTASSGTRIAVRAVLVVLGGLWIIAMLFPFL